MAKQMLIYENAVPISSERHRDLSVETGKDWSFARELNSVPLLAAEFAPAAGQHVIVFAGEGDQVFPVIILGARPGLNAHIGEKGEWLTDYVPAFLRRYPFVFSSNATPEDDKLTLCIDMSFSGVNTDGRGERLFDSQGERTEYLGRMLTFSNGFQAQFERTKAMTHRLRELELLEESRAEFHAGANSETAQATMGGFMTVNRDKLRKLPGDVLEELNRTDALELCHLHLHSLSNLPRMSQRLEAAFAAEEQTTH